MPYTQAHRLLTIAGPLFGGIERWQIGLRFAASDTATQVPQSMVNACEAPIRTWFTSTSTFIASNHSVDQIKLANIETDGHYFPGQVAVVDVPSTAINGGGTGGSTWPQNSFVVSLTTAMPRGRAHIGRIYLPPLRATLIPVAGLMDPANVDSILGTTKTLLNALNAIAGIGSLCVFSKVGTGTTNNITGVRGGLVMDTQRRRRRSIPEMPRSLAL